MIDPFPSSYVHEFLNGTIADKFAVASFQAGEGKKMRVRRKRDGEREGCTTREPERSHNAGDDGHRFAWSR
jgi:hypothetical protein